ncbi:MAG: hypothetical protein JO277_09490 [Candidatus Eremiobacteraeota bacterium]|nr:hypothetical protein [Candidatus Eremiobacteraeota bacterium]
MLSAFILAAALTSPTQAMTAPVYRWIGDFNAARTPLPRDVFTDDAVITDEFAPYVWSGRAGVRAWSEDLDRSVHSPRIRDEKVVVGAPRAFMIDAPGDRASFVLPATLTYVFDGTPSTDRALWFFVVVKDGDAWKISADTWTLSD